MTLLPRYLNRFARDDRGSATILSLYMSLIILIIGGMAIDFQKR